MDELVAECDDLGANRSKIVEVILTAFVQSESNHAERVREIIIRISNIVCEDFYDTLIYSYLSCQKLVF